MDIRINRENENDIEEVRNILKNEFGDAVYGEDEDRLGVIIGRLLNKRGLKIAFAESLTGGLVMHRITNVPGSSKYFLGGVIAYSNDLKKVMLNVKDETLRKFGAVSEETALEMAKGIRKTTGSDIGASTTGIAGPEGGTIKKPVGLVYTAVSGIRGDICERNIFKGNRLMIKEMSAQKVLQLVRQYLLTIHTS